MELGTGLGAIELSDGRALETLISGPEGGPVMLFHHGTPGCVLQDRSFAAAVHARGWRLLTYSRAGYGASSRNAGRSIADVVPDMRELLDAADVDRVYVAGLSGGGPHMLACAALLADRCVAALSIASVAPFGMPDLDYTAGMGEDNVEGTEIALKGEGPLREYLEREAPALREGGGPEVITALASVLPQVDRDVLTGELGDDVAASFQHGLALSVDGWLDDSLAFHEPWGFDPATISIPVSLWQGDQDLMVPFAHGQWLSRAVPGVRTHLEAGQGHLSIAVASLERMLDDLEELGDVS